MDRDGTIRQYVQMGRELLGQLRPGSVLRSVAEPIINDTVGRVGVSLRSTAEAAYFFKLLMRLRYLWFGPTDGRTALGKLELALDALHGRAQADRADEMNRRLQVLTREPRGTDFRQVVAALCEIVVLGCVVRQWGDDVDLWPDLPCNGKPARSDCVLRDREPNVNVEVGAAWTSQDLQDLPSHAVGRLYAKDDLLIERLVGTLRKKRSQMRKCYANVLVWPRLVAFDERDDSLNTNGCHAQFDARLRAELERPTWQCLNLLIAETDSACTLERVYDVHNAARGETARRRLISDIEGAFRAHWYVSDKFEARPIRLQELGGTGVST